MLEKFLPCLITQNCVAESKVRSDSKCSREYKLKNEKKVQIFGLHIID